jgi:hypothetical protein
MFQVQSKKLENLGFYHFIVDDELIKDLKKRMINLHMKSVDKTWRPNNNLIVSICYHGIQAQLLLTIIYDIPISILYLVKDDKFIITTHRFDPSLYNNTILYGELLNNTFVIHMVSFGELYEKVGENLEKLDGILFNKYKEDLDLESIKLSIKEFYNLENEIIIKTDHKAFIYLNQFVKGPHFIKFI